jgi:hypothetical protein
LGAEQVAQVVGKTGDAAAILGRRAVAVQLVRKRMRAAIGKQLAAKLVARLEPLDLVRATRLSFAFPSYLLIDLPSKSTRSPARLAPK